MNKDGGYIKVYRSMLKWEWHDDPVTMATWMYCLMRANYDTQRWHGQIIEPGQFITSLGNMAKDIGISVRQLRTALNHLKSTHEVTSKATSNATLITIEKWAMYQSAGEKATRLATRSATNDRQATDKRPTTIEERKEREESKEDRENKEREYVPNGQGAFHGAWFHEPVKNDVSILEDAHKGWLETKKRYGML